MADLVINTADLGLGASSERGTIETVDVDGRPVTTTAGGAVLAERIEFVTDDDGTTTVELTATDDLDDDGVFYEATIGPRFSRRFVKAAGSENLVDTELAAPPAPFGRRISLDDLANVDGADDAPDGKVLGVTDGVWGPVDGPTGGGDVASVNGQTGVVVIDASDVPFTDPDDLGTGPDTQSAIEYVIGELYQAPASNVSFANGGTGLAAQDAQAAIAEVQGNVAAEAALARNAGNLNSGTVDDARIPSTIARDSEVTSAIAAHEADTTNVHGIADMAALATSSSVTAAVDVEASARSTADSTHAALTTTAHGIPTQIDAKITTHAAATDPHGDRAYADAHIADASAAHAASAVSFTPAGTIAATNVQTAIEEVAAESSPLRTFDASLYGAVHDGTTDDRAAIQAAIDACSTAGGGVVHLPAGTYLIKRPLFLASKVTLRGAGRGVTTITKPASVKSVLTANASAGATSVTVTSSAGFEVGGAIHLSDTSSFEWLSTQGRITNITGNVITFANDEGLGRTGLDGALQTARSATAYSSFPLIRNVKGSTKIVVRDLTLDQAAGANDPTPTSSSVNGVTDFTLATIHWVETYHTLVENCELLNASGDAYSDQAQDGTGVTPTAGIIIETRNTIRGCRINAATRHGVHVGTCADGAIVVNNVITGCGWYGYFYCAYATNGVASGNIIDQCGSGFAGGDDRDTGNVINGNIIKDCASWSISFSDSGAGGTLPFSLVISNNVIQLGTTGKGILIDTPNSVISGNHISSVSTCTDFLKVTLNADRCNIVGNVITQTTGASGSRGIDLQTVDDVRLTGNQIRGVQNGVSIIACARLVAVGNSVSGTTARDWQFQTTTSTDCRLSDNQGTRAVAYDEDVAPVRLVYNGLGSNGSADPASSGDWFAVTGKRWNGSMVRWNSGGGEKVSIYFMGVGWTALN